jgi:uncharacterized membrane protein YphA (DoxX/SURF4 family)
LNKVTIVLRVLLGLGFVVFGANKFLDFMPAPEPPTGAAGEFLGGLAASGYMFKLIGATEVVGGLLVLSGGFTPLGLVVLAPVSVNIFLFHLMLQPELSDAAPGYAMFGLNLVLGLMYLPNYAGLFRGRRET